MLLREISVRTRYKSKVHFEGLGVIQIITGLYLSCIKKYDAGEFCKIVIEIGEQVEENGIDRMLNVIAVKKQFDLRNIMNQVYMKEKKWSLTCFKKVF